jgi:hypothetical protein
VLLALSSSCEGREIAVETWDVLVLLQNRQQRGDLAVVLHVPRKSPSDQVQKCLHHGGGSFEPGDRLKCAALQEDDAK